MCYLNSSPITLGSLTIQCPQPCSPGHVSDLSMLPVSSLLHGQVLDALAIPTAYHGHRRLANSTSNVIVDNTTAVIVSVSQSICPPSPHPLTLLTTHPVLAPHRPASSPSPR